MLKHLSTSNPPLRRPSVPVLNNLTKQNALRFCQRKPWAVTNPPVQSLVSAWSFPPGLPSLALTRSSQRGELARPSWAGNGTHQATTPPLDRAGLTPSTFPDEVAESDRWSFRISSIRKNHIRSSAREAGRDGPSHTGRPLCVSVCQSIWIFTSRAGGFLFSPPKTRHFSIRARTRSPYCFWRAVVSQLSLPILCRKL